MKRALLVLCGTLGLVGGAVRADDSAFTNTGGLDSLNGEQIYTHICQGCHMPGGQGAVGAGFYPTLAGNKKLVSWQYAALTVLNGRNGMPAFGLPSDQAAQTRAVHLSDAQVAAVVNYVRSHFDNHFRDAANAQAVAHLPHPNEEIAPF